MDALIGSRPRGECLLSFKIESDKTRHVKLALNNESLERLEREWLKVNPNQTKFNMKLFFLSEYSPRDFRLAALTLAQGSENMTEKKYRSLVRRDQMHWKENWKTIQFAFCYWANIEEVTQHLNRFVGGDDDEDEDFGDEGNFEEPDATPAP